MFEPEQTKVKQVISDIDNNILKYNKLDNEQEGDDSDFSDNEDKEKEKMPEPKMETSKNTQMFKKRNTTTRPVNS